MNLVTSLDHVKGVGVKTAEQFALAGLYTVNDLIHFLPRSYDDFSEVVPLAEIKPGKVTVKAVCERIATKNVRRGLRVTTATLSDGTGKI